MGTFLIERGHDGPARSGVWKTQHANLQTPFLLTPFKRDDFETSLFILDRDEPDAAPFILGIPNILFSPSLTSARVKNALLVLLPSLAGITSPKLPTGPLLLEAQIDWLQKQKTFPPDQAALKVPSNVPLDVFCKSIRKASILGIRAAVFEFSSRLGPSDFASVVLRANLPRNWLSIAIGRIEPFMLPLLLYLGFDGFDVSRAHEAAQLRQRLWRMDVEPITTPETGRYCPCTACHKGLPSNESSLKNTLHLHNSLLYRTLLSESIAAKTNGTLRWLVEAITHSSPAMAAFLRRVDSHLYSFLEEFTPTNSTASLLLIGPKSYNAPAIRRFRERLVERYSPPDYKKLILLLPCSAKKPYSESKSHQRFLQTIDSALGRKRKFIAEVILTSPLGIIPRELERLYPVANYDIPVTGDWDAEEIQIASATLISHLKKFSSSAVVVAHVTGGYKQVVQAAEAEIEQTIVYTAEGSATSNRSLSALKATLNDFSDILGFENGSRTLIDETLRATADFQFGPGAATLLIPKGSRLSGKLYHTVICKTAGVQTCAYLAENGLLSLTLHGAQRLHSLGTYWVRYNGDRISGGSLFAVAVSDADPLIRPGDEVIVLNTTNEVVAVGRSEMSGKEMCEFDNGRAVTVRHKLR